MLCNQCSTNLPDDSQFCLKCGQKVESAAHSVALATISVRAACDQCGATLSPTAEFCRMCGRPVIAPANGSDLPSVLPPGFEPLQPLPVRRPHQIVAWVLVLLFLGAVLWAATSETPEAQQVQEFVHWAHTQTVVDAALSVNPGSFSSSEFTVPPGALSVSLAGEFSETPGSPRKREKSHGTGKDGDTGIEAYVLTDAAFVVWRSGYATQTQYESGPVAGATINARLPGAGVYHLVFSNKSSPRDKIVHATVQLRYKRWLPDAIVHLKDDFWNWLGL